MRVLINHRVEAVLYETVIGKVIVCLLNEKQIFGCDYLTVKHAIADGPDNMTVFVS